MPDTATKPIVVSENAGIFDVLQAAGRYFVVILAAIPILLQILGAHDFEGFVAYFQGAEGKTLVGAVVGMLTLAYGLWKTHKRGAQIATVAIDERVPNSVAKTTG